jgi:membrane-bound ClpP family serine protease
MLTALCAGCLLFTLVVAFVCFVMLVIKMFQNGRAGLAILSIVSCVVGALIAYIVGFKNGKEWGTSKTATIGLVAFVISAVLFSALVSMQIAENKRILDAREKARIEEMGKPTLDAPVVDDIPF